MSVPEIPTELGSTHHRDPIRPNIEDDDAASIRTVLPSYSVHGPQTIRPPSPAPTYRTERPPSPTPTYRTTVEVQYTQSRTALDPMSRSKVPVELLNRIEKYERAVTICPGDTSAWTALGYLLSTIDCDKAIEAFKAAINNGTEDARLWCYLGNIYEQKGDIDKALTAYRSALRLAPDQASPWAYCGKMYKAKSDYRNAIEAYLMVVQLKPEDQDAWLNLGDVYKATGDSRNTIKAYETATKCNLFNFKAWKSLLDAYTKNGVCKPAEALDAAIKDPSDQWLRLRLAEINAANGDYDVAITEYEMAVRQRPKDIELSSRLGNMYKTKGDYSAAAKIYKTILNQPQISTYFSIPIQQCLGEVYEAMGDYGKAIKEYKTILNQRPNDISLLGHVGNVYEQKGEIENAINAYELVIQKNPKNNLCLRLHLQELYRRRNSDNKKDTATSRSRR